MHQQGDCRNIEKYRQVNLRLIGDPSKVRANKRDDRKKHINATGPLQHKRILGG